MSTISFFSAALFLFALASCRQEKTVSVAYDPELGYTVQINSGELEGIEKLSLVTIDDEGLRDGNPQEVELGEQGILELSIPENSFYLDRFEGLAEKRSAFGLLPVEDLGAEFEFEKKLSSRFELFNPEQAESQSLIHYLQMNVDYENRSVLNGQASKASWSLSYVGVVEVSLRDFDGKVIPDALVSLVPHDKQGPIKPWSNSLYRPVLMKTNQEGRARLFPVPVGIDGAGFQIIASGANYCTHVTETYSSSVFVGQVIDVTLKPCDLSKVDPSLPAKPNLSFEDPSSHGNGHERFLDRAYFNQNHLNVRIDYLGENLRPLEISLSNIDNLNLSSQNTGPESEPLKKVRQDWPGDAIDFDIADYVKDDELEQFAVDAQQILPKREQDQLGQRVGKVRAFASISKKAPEVTVAQFLVQSSVNEWNIISGLDAESFLVSTTGCPDGQYGHVALFEITDDLPNLESLHFVPCRSSVVRYATKDLGLVDQGQGGVRLLGVAVKDRYGNVSQLEANIAMKIYVDFGIPDIAGEQPVLVGDRSFDVFGLTRKPGMGGFIDAIRGIPNAGQIPFNSLASYEFGFRSEQTCMHSNANTADGVEEIGLRGQYIHDWSLSDNLATLFSKKTRYGCMDRVSLSDIITNKTAIKKQGFLTLYLQVHDLAGHLSNIQKINIGVCSSATLRDDHHGYCLAINDGSQ